MFLQKQMTSIKKQAETNVIKSDNLNDPSTWKITDDKERLFEKENNEEQNLLYLK